MDPEWLKKAKQDSTHPKIVNQQEAAEQDKINFQIEEKIKAYLKVSYWGFICSIASLALSEVKISREFCRGIPVHEDLIDKQLTTHTLKSVTEASGYTEYKSCYPGYRLSGYLPDINTWIYITLTVCFKPDGTPYSHIYLRNNGVKLELHQSEINPKNPKELQDWLIYNIAGLIRGDFPRKPTALESAWDEDLSIVRELVLYWKHTKGK